MQMLADSLSSKSMLGVSFFFFFYVWCFIDDSHVCPQMAEEVKELSGAYKGSSTIHKGGALWPNHLQGPYIQVASHWGLGFQFINFGDIKHGTYQIQVTCCGFLSLCGEKFKCLCYNAAWTIKKRSNY